MIWAIPTEPEVWAFSAVVIGSLWRAFYVYVGRKP